MAFDSNGIKFLLYAKRRGVDFRSTATIGRQFNFAPPSEIQDLFSRTGEPRIALESIEALLDEQNSFSEGIFGLLGARITDSFDASDFEGATHVYDFNYPIPEELKAKYSSVLDGGTLEHVFNYPTALKNCMEMVAEGGHFLGITPTNNFPGHGFYQFSPELFFQAFSVENGFEIVDVIFMEDFPEAPWYRITDAATVRRRVTFENSRSAYLLLIARRISIKPIFERFPQQSDYASAWRGEAVQEIEAPGLIERLPRAVSRRVKRLARPGAIRFEAGDLVRFDPFT